MFYLVMSYTEYNEKCLNKLWKVGAFCTNACAVYKHACSHRRLGVTSSWSAPGRRPVRLEGERILSTAPDATMACELPLAPYNLRLQSKSNWMLITGPGLERLCSYIRLYKVSLCLPSCIHWCLISFDRHNCNITHYIFHNLAELDVMLVRSLCVIVSSFFTRIGVSQ